MPSTWWVVRLHIHDAPCHQLILNERDAEWDAFLASGQSKTGQHLAGLYASSCEEYEVMMPRCGICCECRPQHCWACTDIMIRLTEPAKWGIATITAVAFTEQLDCCMRGDLALKTIAVLGLARAKALTRVTW